jgi:hypothetical protein
MTLAFQDVRSHGGEVEIPGHGREALVVDGKLPESLF